MRQPANRRYLPLSLALVLALLAGCNTLDYRDIQSDFNTAVELDNQFTVSTSPFVEGPGYSPILEKLTPEYIAELDARLQPNAYLLRSFALWRLDELEAARQSALTGSGLGPPEGSRDGVLLKLMPALVIDREMEKRWNAADRTLSKQTYDRDEPDHPSYHASYVAAIGKIGAAEDAATDSTPQGTSFYLAYQRWRLLSNWDGIISSIEGPDEDIASTARIDAWRAAEAVIGQELESAADASRDSIPADYPLRLLIVEQGG